MAGVIQFSIQGGREFHGGMMEATKDENAVLFTHQQGSEFSKLHALIEKAIIPEIIPRQDSRSELDDLTKLVELYEKGYLTKEEFENRKGVLLQPPGHKPRPPSESSSVRQPSPKIELAATASAKATKIRLPWWAWVVALIVGITLIFSLVGRRRPPSRSTENVLAVPASSTVSDEPWYHDPALKWVKITKPMLGCQSLGDDTATLKAKMLESVKGWRNPGAKLPEGCSKLEVGEELIIDDVQSADSTSLEGWVVHGSPYKWQIIAPSANAVGKFYRSTKTPN